MARRAGNPDPGDIFEVRTPRGLAYFQLADVHPKFGEAIRILPGFFPVRPPEFLELVDHARYFAFYPVSAALRQGLVAHAAHLDLAADQRMPPRLRRAGAIARSGEVLTWLVSQGADEVLRRELSLAERQLPIGEIWNHEFLIQRLCDEWTPESSLPNNYAQPRENGAARQAGGGDRSRGIPQRSARRLALETLSSASDTTKPHEVSHYLYFSSESRAHSAAEAARAAGFEIDLRRSADDSRWLVLARLTVLPAAGTMHSAESTLRKLATDHDGEYDGWEAKTSR